MDKIKDAQKLADELLDEVCQVGNDKGALKDEPESVEKSEKDIKKAVKMEEAIDELLEASAKVNAIRLGIARNDKNYEEGNDMDPKAKANAKKRAEDKEEAVKENSADFQKAKEKFKKKERKQEKLKSNVNFNLIRKRLQQKGRKIKKLKEEESLAAKLRRWAGMSTKADKKKNPQASNKNLNKYGATFSVGANKQFKKLKDGQKKPVKK